MITKNQVHHLTYTHFDSILLGDSIAAGFFKESLNLGIGGDRTQHILWWVERLSVPSHLKYVIIKCGTNNIRKHSPSEIANSILCIALSPGFFRGMESFSRFCISIPQINQLLKIFTSTYYFIDFLEPAKD